MASHQCGGGDTSHTAFGVFAVQFRMQIREIGFHSVLAKTSTETRSKLIYVPRSQLILYMSITFVTNRDESNKMMRSIPTIPKGIHKLKDRYEQCKIVK